MLDLDDVTRWVDSYVAAWNSNDRTEIGALFTEDADYFTDPFGPPWSGRDEIVTQWLARKDQPGETTFTWHPVVLGDDIAIVQGVTTYPQMTFSNLWVVRFDPTGRSRSFTEWWMEHPKT